VVDHAVGAITFAFKVRLVISRTLLLRRSHCSDDPAPAGQRCDTCDRACHSTGCHRRGYALSRRRRVRSRNGQLKVAGKSRFIVSRRQVVDLVFRLDHASRLDQIEAAFAAAAAGLGRERQLS
jgi:hypothetical protein